MNFNFEKSIGILERTPDTLRTMLYGISVDWTDQNEGADTWSAHDVLDHLIHCEEADWVLRAEIILSNDPDKTFEPFDPSGQLEKSKGKSLEQLLDEFTAWRKKNMARLVSKNLSEKDLVAVGVHPVFGEVALSQLLSAWVVHDLNHIAQISRVMAKQYDTAVGPWKAYLGILK